MDSRPLKLVCPACKSDIAIDDIDFGSESAFCSHCQKDFDCRKWLLAAYTSPENLEHPPPGAWFGPSVAGFRVGVSTRSYRWLFFLPVASFWSGLLSFFSYGFSHAPLGMRWVLFLCLAPFYVAGLLLWAAALMPICGRVVVEIDKNAGTIFQGIGPIGWKRRFDVSQVEKIRIGTVYNSKVGNQQQIALEGKKSITFATGVRLDRLRFLFIALHQMLSPRRRYPEVRGVTNDATV